MKLITTYSMYHFDDGKIVSVYQLYARISRMEILRNNVFNVFFDKSLYSNI